MEEEEEKTTETALNGDGNVSDEVLNESNEGLLEHAMNDSLLNDDDCERFHESITRIQRRSSKFVEEDKTITHQDKVTTIRR